MSGEAILRVTSPFYRNCELCHKPTKNLYRIVLDGYGVLVCSEACAIKARNNWMAKKNDGITPNEKPMEEESMMEDGGLPEEE
jgi:ribosome-binding protein aMBF1 (putative translation factor)